ncbi:nitronate monooxygenase [Thalassovita sp.]|uniref:NAD(P)H-dependent flavin oxidoreductase n=1 Tax=Thalassovita sp. TaxID=1979401 RepID=UPI0029DE58B0|nr:nitronate monooxygenase [Thalassovita sp.]
MTQSRTTSRADAFAALRVPVVCAPMFLVTGPDMVIAACRAGIVGALPAANARPIEVLDDWMRRITDALDAARAAGENPAPWAFNLMTHSTNSRLDDELALVARYRPPVVITALGSPRPAIEVVHGYGGLVIGDVINIKLAKKAAAVGVDGLACISSGAGGHTGSLSPFAFVTAVRRFFDGLVILGGGISDGFGVAGAIAAGADLVYMGTRFIACKESLAPEAYKRMMVECDIEDLVVSASITGTPASWLKPSLSAAGLDPDNLPDPQARNYDGNRPISARRWVDTWSAGQGVGVIDRVAPMAEIVTTLEQDFHRAQSRFQRLHPTEAPAAAEKNPQITPKKDRSHA